MAKENEHVIFKKEITISHIISTAMIIIAGFWFAAEQNTRITLLEVSDISQAKVVDKMSSSLESIDKKMSTLIENSAFERGKIAGKKRG